MAVERILKSRVIIFKIKLIKNGCLKRRFNAQKNEKRS